MRWMPFVDVFLSPLGFGLLLALVLWLARRRLSRGSLRIGIAIEIVLLVLSTPLGANALVAWQESRAPLPDACAAPMPSTIVVLSGGIRRDAADARDFATLNVASLQRTIAGAELARSTPDAQLVLAGGPRIGGQNDVSQAAVMATIAEGFGVPAASIRAESLSTTTWENATRVRALDPPLPQRIWLVTSATHMPRSLLAFRAAGFEPCAYPADRRASPFDGPADFLPSAGAIANTDAVLHEWIGEIAYRARSAF
ncbi:MAG: YdcF family protein [Rhodanobacteraceae bacterium]